MWPSIIILVIGKQYFRNEPGKPFLLVPVLIWEMLCLSFGNIVFHALTFDVII